MGTTTDPTAYYGYLFESNKKPSKMMTLLLTGIANYICNSLGELEVSCLSPRKLAAFYRAVGGNYDSVFLDLPEKELSFIYRSIGCQHSLQQPPDNNYAAPTIPVLTCEGFVRWQSIETLLDPGEHVPYLQKAVNELPIINPETNKRFPADLPTTALPTEPDPAIVKWHTKCADKLRKDVSSDEQRSRPSTAGRDKPDIRAAYAHIKVPHYSYSATSSPKERGWKDRDYFNSKPVLRRQRTTANTPRQRSSYDAPHRTSASPHPPQESETENLRGRRRSVPQNYYSNVEDLPTPGRPSSHPPHSPHEGLKVPEDEHVRWHSHPRHRRERSSSSPTSVCSSAESDASNDPPSPLYTTKRGTKPKEVPVESRRDPPIATVRYTTAPGSKSTPQIPEHVTDAAAAMFTQRHRGLSAPLSSRTDSKGPTVTAYRVGTDTISKRTQEGHEPSSRSNSKNRKADGNVRWYDLIDLPFGRRHSHAEKEPHRKYSDREEKEKYRSGEIQPRMRQGSTQEQRGSKKERERRDRHARDRDLDESDSAGRRERERFIPNHGQLWR